jgi:2-dehydropantoate 2-reductase
MRIVVVGVGAVGGYYAAHLIRAGHDVHLLARSDADVLRTRGLVLQFGAEEWTVRAAAVCTRSQDVGPVDWILCALKTTAIDRVEALIRPFLTDDSLILNFMNGLGVDEHLARRFEADRILGCLSYVSAHRHAPGQITCYAPGRIVLGHLRDDRELGERVADAWRSAGIETRVSGNLARARWEKLVWNAAFNPLSVTAGGVTAKQIIDDPGLRATVEGLMLEIIAVARAEGCDFDADRLVGTMIEKTDPLGHIKTSMLVDYEARRPMELEWILAEPIRRAEQTGVPVPLLREQLARCRDLERARLGPAQAE